MALADPSRRAILENLRFGPKSVSELVLATGFKQPNVSNHLAKLRTYNLVHGERIGRHVYYAISLPLADLVLRLHEWSGDTLDQSEYTRRESAPAAAPAGAARSSAGSQIPIKAWREEFLDSILNGLEDRALYLVHEMLARRISLMLIYTDVFEWCLNRVGDRVEQQETDVAHEHLASEITVRMMARATQFYTPVARSPCSAILGCVAGNRHAIGLRMLGDALRIQGWQTNYLGADVPTDSFVELANSVRPDLVLISCGMEEQAPELHRLIEGLRAARSKSVGATYRIVIGGRYVSSSPSLADQFSADWTAGSLPEFVKNIPSILTPDNCRPPL